MLLGTDNAVTRVSAFTTLLQPHLPPIDTINATLRTKSGVSGTLAMSFGTTFKGSGFAVACEQGTVTVLEGKVTVQKSGVEETQEYEKTDYGVRQEVKAWCESLTSGFQHPSQMPEEALEDLRLVSAEMPECSCPVLMLFAA